ncbi:MAG: VCBS repeat-containing protein, partial [Deferribacteres bacterium]|nr:VCBS repeat-containing protein [Deferribacteres bacterium]
MMDNKHLGTGPAPDYSINNILGARSSLFTAALIALLLIMTGLWLSPEAVYAIEAGQFVEVTQDAGIDYSNRRTFGVSWGDMNGDGLPDIWINHHARKPTLYINNGDGTFTDATESVSNGADMHGAAWADFDNDGDQDLFQIVGAGSGTGEGPNQFLINNNGLSLEDKAADYGLNYPEGRGRTPLWFDWNGDGYLDIFLSNLKRSDGLAPSALFTQRNGYFTNDNDLTGIETNMGSDPVFAQLTHLGSGNAPALVIYSNSYPSYSSPHRVYQYDTVPFKDITDTLGLSTRAVEDAAVADFNGDLLTDFYFARAYINSSVIKYNDTTIRAGIIMVKTDTEKSFSFRASGDVTFKLEFEINPNLYKYT